VWRLDTGKWSQATVVDGGYESIASTFSVVADINRLSDKVVAEVRPYPAPTPPATVEGDGPWIIEQVGDECLLHNPTLSVAEVRTFKVSRNGITWLRDILNKQHAESKRLREALEAMVAMAAPNVYPQPDKENSNWATLERARTALAGGNP
jgi:hypothetical protein